MDKTRRWLWIWVEWVDSADALWNRWQIRWSSTIRCKACCKKEYQWLITRRIELPLLRGLFPKIETKNADNSCFQSPLVWELCIKLWSILRGSGRACTSWGPPKRIDHKIAVERRYRGEILLSPSAFLAQNVPFLQKSPLKHLYTEKERWRRPTT